MKKPNLALSTTLAPSVLLLIATFGCETNHFLGETGEVSGGTSSQQTVGGTQASGGNATTAGNGVTGGIGGTTAISTSTGGSSGVVTSTITGGGSGVVDSTITGGSNGTGGSNSLVCGDHGSFAVSPTTNPLRGTTGPVDGGPYGGLAKVIESSASQLVLEFVATAETGGIKSVESQAPITRQLTITGGARSLGVFPLGAQVWLDKTPAGPQGADSTMYGVLPWAFAVRAAKGGQLLLGAAFFTTDSSTSPVPIGSITAQCSQDAQDTCWPKAVRTFNDVAVIGDSTTVIHDDEVVAVMIGGAPYDINALSRNESSSAQFTCADFRPQFGTLIGAQLQNLTQTAAALPIMP